MEYRVGGGTDFNENGGWLKIKSKKVGKQIFIEFYKGDDGFWSKNPLFVCDSHWIDEIIYGLQRIQEFLDNKEK